MASATATRPTVLRNTCTVAAILGFGLVAGALLAETSMMNFSLTSPRAFSPRRGGMGSVNGFLAPGYSLGQSRRPVSQRSGIAAHHMGL